MLPVVLAATFIYAFDFNVVNVALPTLQRDLHAGPVALELVVGGYAFTYSAGLVTGGRLGDLFGYRLMFLSGMAAFTASSMLCGLSTTPSQLVAARLIQGLTAAAMVPQVLALITATFPPTERTRAFAWFGVTGAVSGVVGQVLGGLILDANVAGLGWRAIFFVNLPIGAVVFALAHRILPRLTTDRRPSLDLIGVVGISGALALALVPLTLGRSEGWPTWMWIALAASVPAMTLALRFERSLARRGGDPLMDLSLFASPAFRRGPRHRHRLHGVLRQQHLRHEPAAPKRPRAHAVPGWIELRPVLPRRGAHCPRWPEAHRALRRAGGHPGRLRYRARPASPWSALLSQPSARASRSGGWSQDSGSSAQATASSSPPTSAPPSAP